MTGRVQKRTAIKFLNERARCVENYNQVMAMDAEQQSPKEKTGNWLLPITKINNNNK